MNKVFSEISNLFSAERRKDMLLYLLFVLVAAIFWLMLTLNNEVQDTYDVRMKVVNMPDSATLIQDFPEFIKVSIKDKGSSLIKYSLGTKPSVELDFEHYKKENGIVRVSSTDLRNMLNKTFGNAGDIISITPDSLISHYTFLPGKRVPVVSRVEAKANFKCVINGKIELSQDSVTVYSTRSILNQIKNVYTEKVDERDLKDTTIIDVPLQSLSNVKIVPAQLQVTIPVEPLIMKTITVNIAAKGVPHGFDLVTFPGKVELRYLVPSSMYKKSQNFNAEVLYDDVSRKKSKLPLYITGIKWEYGEITPLMDSVEYIVENHR